MPLKAPRIYSIVPPPFPVPQKLVLSNGLNIYLLEGGGQELVKLELIFFSGRPFEKKPLVARVTNNLLVEGSEKVKGFELAEELDFYGTSLELPFNLDTGNLSLYVLSNKLNEVLELLAKAMEHPAFPKKELIALKNRSEEKLKEDIGKVDVLAYRKLTELIFGDDHPYGYNSSEVRYREITRQDLVEHFRNCYRGENGVVILSGKIPKGIFEVLENTLGKAFKNGFKDISPELSEGNETLPFGKYPIKAKQNQQTAIRAGFEMFNRSHPDYPGMYVLTTILGGYFGSRLMSNLREDQGITYNAYAHIETLRYGGYLSIGTEVSKGKEEEAIAAIIGEIIKLKEKLVPARELKMVKSYLKGSYLTVVDGPFNQAGALRELLIEGLPLNYFDFENETVEIITSQKIRELANKYFNLDKMYWVTAGNTDYS